MRQRYQSILTFIVFYIFFLVNTTPFSKALAEKADIDLRLRGQVLSASFEEVALKSIFERLEKERGIWFQGEQSLLEERVSVQFENLSLEHGMRRILARMNHCLVFEEGGKLIGIIILGKSDKDRALALTRVVSTKTPFPPKSSEEQETPGMFEVIRNMPPPDNPNVKPIDMTIIKNSPPPGNPDAPPIDTTVVRDRPPPGNPNAESMEHGEVQKVSPPGD